MLISFTGAQCTGKTTLLNALKKQLTSDEWKFVPEVTRKIKREGFKINEQGSDLTQLFILKEHLQNHIINDNENWVLDRCIMDGYVYTQYLYEKQTLSSWILDYAKELYYLLVHKLDVIFYTEPEDIPVVDDGERSVNGQFRNDIIDIFESKIQMLSEFTDVKLVRLKGSVEQRMLTIKNNLNYE